MEQAATPMGGLRLDSRESILHGGGRGPAIVAGKPKESLLIKAVQQTDASLKMPPGKKLSDAEIATLAQWIAMGAPWGAQPVAAAAHRRAKILGFIPPKDPALPQVQECRLGEVAASMRFVLAGSRGQEPDARAARRASAN